MSSNNNIAIPAPHDFFNHILKQLKESSVPIARSELANLAVDAIIAENRLPQSIREISKKRALKNGGYLEYSIIENRASWGISYLKILELITNEQKRAFWQITKLGLESYPVDCEKYLQKLRQIIQKTSKSKITEEEDEAPEDIGQKEDMENWKAEALLKLSSMKPTSFEAFCAKFLAEMGFNDVKVTQSTRDGGFDASAILRQGILSTRVLVECKKYKEGNNVGREDVQKLRGAMKSNHVDKGIIFTTADFTKDAQECARSIGDIELICGDEICNLMKKYDFGVRTEMRPIVFVEHSFIEKF